MSSSVQETTVFAPLLAAWHGVAYLRLPHECRVGVGVLLLDLFCRPELGDSRPLAGVLVGETGTSIGKQSAQAHGRSRNIWQEQGSGAYRKVWPVVAGSRLLSRDFSVNCRLIAGGGDLSVVVHG